MKLISQLMLLALVLIAGAQLSACGAASVGVAGKEKDPPFVKEGNNLVLSDKAAKRLDIQTAQVRDEQVTRKLTTWGEVVDLPGSDGIGVRVRIQGRDLDRLDKDQPATLLLADGTTRIRANLPEAGGTGGTGTSQEDLTLYYVVEGLDQSLEAGQYVRLELATSGGAVQRKVVAYSAVLYDVQGDTWVYISPNSLTFTRQRVVVDFIDGDLAYLTEGPPAGTTVVTVGASELFGAETGVGH